MCQRLGGSTVNNTRMVSDSLIVLSGKTKDIVEKVNVVTTRSGRTHWHTTTITSKETNETSLPFDKTKVKNMSHRSIGSQREICIFVILYWWTTTTVRFTILTILTHLTKINFHLSSFFEFEKTDYELPLCTTLSLPFRCANTSHITSHRLCKNGSWF